MFARPVFYLFVFLLFTVPAQADCPVPDPYKQGSYANEMVEFAPGFYLQVKDLGQRLVPRRLHPSRTLYPSILVLGCPKTSLETSLTLGHGGYVVLSANKCFRNGKGADIVIHEPRSHFNVNESFNVYVTTDKKAIGPWYLVARNQTVNRGNNFLALDIGKVITANGHEAAQFAWLKIEDSDSKRVPSNKRYSGFDLSSVKFIYQCDVPVG